MSPNLFFDSLRLCKLDSCVLNETPRGAVFRSCVGNNNLPVEKTCFLTSVLKWHGRMDYNKFYTLWYRFVTSSLYLIIIYIFPYLLRI